MASVKRIATSIAFSMIILVFGTLGFSEASADEKVVTGNNHYGCTSLDYQKKLLGFVVDRDRAAFERGLAAGIAAGGCTVFHTGDRVFLADTAITSGMVKLRRKGEVAEYWTAMEAIR
ncbi:MAG: hypothetical protein ACOY3Z_01575 [Thermodesulfobacteriota bacterium]